MKQLLLKKGKVVVEETPDPIPDSNEVLVANAFSAVSVGTERSIILNAKKGKIQKLLEVIGSAELRRKALDYIKSHGISRSYQVWKQTSMLQAENIRIGYSSAGIVIQVGKNVVDIDVGDKVACAGVGYACHSELITVPRNLVVKLPDGVDLLDASFATIGSVPLHALRLSNVQPGEYVSVIGTGLIGLIAVQLAKFVFNAKVVAVDKDAFRVQLARNLGVDMGMVLTNSNKREVVSEILNWTDNLGVDTAVITAAGRSSLPVNFGLEILRSRGKIVVVGDVPVNVDRALMYQKEASLIVSRSYGPGRYDPVYEIKGLDYPIDYVRWTLNRNMTSFLEFVKDGKVKLRPLITKIVGLEGAPSIYDEILEGKGQYLGLVISYESQKYLSMPFKHRIEVAAPAPIITPKSIVAKNRRIKLGIIGAGSFVSNVILPLLLKDLAELYEVIAVCTRHSETCKKVASKAKASYCTTDYAEVLSDNNIDAVIISTPHNLHAKQAVEALNAGKAVFMEKPIALDEGELDKLYDVYKKNSLPITVNFNRRFSLFAYEIRKRVSQKPIYVIYRVNAGFIPQGHWIQDPEVGGGRIIGEICHFIDFLYSIVGVHANELFVSSIPVNKHITTKDNVSILIRWLNGSLTTINYTSMGSPLLPKEYIEIHSGNKSMVLYDFKKMCILDEGRRWNIKLPNQDKGHKSHLIEFAKLVRGQQSNIPPFEEYIYSMKITLEVEKKLRNLATLR
ncbi:MAG: bi-domain-containing oxidoreductase [Candidatus Bathyarchaeia archaeon]